MPSIHIKVKGEPEGAMYFHKYFNFVMLLAMEKRLLHITKSGSPYIIDAME